MTRDPKSPAETPEKKAEPNVTAKAKPAAVEPYEPPKLLKFEKLEKLIVSGE